MTKKFALVTITGTACAETCLCEKHATPENKRPIEAAAAKEKGYDAPLVSKGWRNCTQNDALECQLC